MENQLPKGSALYTRVMAETKHELTMRHVWGPTPWMVEIWIDDYYSPRREKIRDWCSDQFGPESSPIHGLEGKWHMASVTINGFTWIGFATEEAMNTCEQRWQQPQPAAIGR